MHRHESLTQPAASPVRSLRRESFRLAFQERLREYLAQHETVGESFEVIWQRTLGEIALDEAAQRDLYWELVNWARGYELFTNAEFRASSKPPRPGAAAINPLAPLNGNAPNDEGGFEPNL
jgi:hypothetical protein